MRKGGGGVRERAMVRKGEGEGEGRETEEVRGGGEREMGGRGGE